MDRIKSHLIPVVIVGALGAIVFLVVFALFDKLPATPPEFAEPIVYSVLVAQFVAFPFLAGTTKFRPAAVFGILLAMTAFLWGPVEYMMGLATGWWIDDEAELYVQAVAVPAVAAVLMLVTGRPKALFSPPVVENAESPVHE